VLVLLFDACHHGFVWERLWLLILFVFQCSMLVVYSAVPYSTARTYAPACHLGCARLARRDVGVSGLFAELTAVVVVCVMMQP